jgi:hypothetical protein
MGHVWFQFTTYNQIACLLVFLFKQRLFPWFVEVVRGTATLVTLGVALVYVLHGYSTIQAFYLKIYNNKIPRWSIPFLDFANHILPLILVGLPQTWWAIAIAYTVILAWFIMLRTKLHVIYMNGIEFDKIMWLMFLFTLCYVLLKLSQYEFTIPR